MSFDVIRKKRFRHAAVVLLCAVLLAGSVSGYAFGADDEAGADGAALGSLALDGGELSPAFDPNVTAYTAAVPQGVAQAAITASVGTEASLTINGAPAASGEAVAVPVDVKPVRIVVTDQNDSAFKEYTIDWSRPYIVNECLTYHPDWIFCDDFETDKLNELYYDRYNIWGRFSWHRTPGIGGGGALDALYGFYPGDATHDAPYETWLKLAFGKTPDPSRYKPAGDPGEPVRELYWRFYIKKTPGTVTYEDEQEAKGPFVRIHGYGENDTPFMGVEVDYPDDSGVLQARLLAGEFGEDGAPAGVAEAAVLTGTKPIMKRSEADGQWHRIELSVRLNDPGQANGTFDLRIDGEPEMSVDGLDWVGNYTEYGINAVEFRNLNNRPQVPTDSMRIDNMVLSRSPIGAAGTLPVLNNANLSGIAKTAGKLTPFFQTDITAYTLSLEHGVGHTLVTPLLSDEAATLQVNGMPHAAGTPVTVESGERLTIDVTAADGMTTKTYTVDVVSLPPYNVNECAKMKADWLFCDDFEQDRMDQYFEHTRPDQFYRTDSVGLHGSSGMKAEYLREAGSSAGDLKIALGRTPDSYMTPVEGTEGETYTELYWRFYLKHEKEWIGGGADKLSRVTSIQNGDWAQAMAANVWGGVNARQHFMLIEPVSMIGENGELKSRYWNDMTNHTYLGPRWSDIPIFGEDQVGEWYAIEAHVKLNDPGQANGVFEVWIDDELAIARYDLNWVDTFEIGPDAGFGLNWLSLENYWNEGTPVDQERYFDNFVVSTGRIGLSVQYSDADLDGLSINGANLRPKFDPAVTEYTVELPFGTNAVSLTAAHHQYATMTVNGQAAPNGETVEAAVEDGAITIVVTAEDGVTVKTYTIHVSHRAPIAVNECAKMKAHWLFCDDFEQDRMDQYFEHTRPDQFYRTDGAGLDGSSGMVAQWRYAGDVNAGDLKLGLGRTPDDYVRAVAAEDENLREVYWRFYVRHEEDWEGHGADKLTRATSLLPPAYDEEGNQIRAGWSQAMIAHVWSGSPGSAAQYQLSLDPASGTDPAGNVVSTRYNDFDNLRWLGRVDGTKPIFDEDHVGVWYAVETHVKLNDPGESNGVFELWIDDELEIGIYDLNWVGAFDEYGINGIFIENYWNSGSVKAQERYFDNLVVSRSKIGLAEMDLQDGFDALAQLAAGIAHPGTKQAIAAHFSNAQRFFEKAAESGDNGGQAEHFRAKGIEALHKAADKIASYRENLLNPAIQGEMLRWIGIMIHLGK